MAQCPMAALAAEDVKMTCTPPYDTHEPPTNGRIGVGSAVHDCGRALVGC